MRGHNPSRSLESNGPAGRIRGTADQLRERYEEQAREARLKGDRVLEQSCMQHAEHYRRQAGR